MKKVKRIGIVYDAEKESARKAADEVSIWLKEQGLEVFFQPLLDEKSLDVILTFGGDGLILCTANRTVEQKLSIPLVRINFGKMGFLTNVEPDEIFEKLKKLLDNNCITIKRTRIEVEAHSKVKNEEKVIKANALNDVVIERTQTRAVSFTIIVNQKERIERRGDGIIFATKTGSTAYNRSVGGPILVKENNLIFTVISPTDPEQSFYFVRPADSVFLIDKIDGETRMVIDGKELLPLAKDDKIVIRKSPQSTFFIEFGDV